MREAGTRSGRRELGAGLRELCRHRPDKALRLLREAVDACPAARPAELSARLYWLSVALLRLDRPELALKSLASAQKLRPRGFARAAYAARSNEYGMPRRARPELDDFYAFYSLQACRYLGSRPGGRFAAAAEKDAVTRLIAEAWTGLRASGRLAGLGPGGKLALFRSWPLAFPSFVSGGRVGVASGPQGPGQSGPRAAGPGAILPANFRRGAAVGPDERCSCGSGLAYRCCCGRLSSPRGLSCE